MQDDHRVFTRKDGSRFMVFHNANRRAWFWQNIDDEYDNSPLGPYDNYHDAFDDALDIQED